ncbi:MAG: 8-oxo-dGTP diphosphatase [Lachnospiraceae bacterium]|nr:8-oxo-dGTP diphosphatase [Lachnospiraceae bacterium]
MKRSTLCYLEKDGCYLMMLRNKKKADVNAGKWIGVGGKFEEGETPDECLKREVLEETGVTLKAYVFVGVIGFRLEGSEDEDMYLYKATDWEGNVNMDCNEGTLKWIPKKEIPDLDLWEGDRLFLEKMLQGEDHINLDLFYKNDVLIESTERREV